MKIIENMCGSHKVYEESVSFTNKEGNVDATIPTPWETSGECLRVAKESFVKLPLTMKDQRSF